jgi:hypothetical protein
MPDPTPEDLGWAGQLAERLIGLADAGRTGTLHVPGPPGGVVVLAAGLVGIAETLAAPSAEVVLVHGGQHLQQRDLDAWTTLLAGGRDAARQASRQAAGALLADGAVRPERVEAVVHAATVDAVWLLARPPEGPAGVLRFREGQSHPLVAVRPLPVPALLAELAGRRAVMGRIGDRVGPRTVLSRAAALPRGRLRLTAAQWELVRAVDGASPVTELAWTLARGAFATLIDAYRLVRLGVLEPDQAQGAVPSAGSAPAQTRGGARRPELSFVRTRSRPLPPTEE